MAQINKPTDYFNTKLYTGNGSTQSITGVGFQPDFTWIKDRTNAYGHDLYDVIRGATNRIQSNDAGAESSASGLTSFDSDGFSLGSYVGDNTNTANYVSWNWLAGGTASSNTQGDITSSVSANTTAGFSIVSYTGNGTNPSTIGHGLGKKPDLMIVKSRQDADAWLVGSDKISGWNWSSDYLHLNATSGKMTDAGGTAFNTAPTSSVFSVGAYLNGSGENYIAYMFTSIKGFSKIGTYTGNGSADGTFVYTGMRPSFLMLKRTDTTGSWHMYDNKRDTYNPETKRLGANLSSEESSAGSIDIDFLSQGFKMRNSTADWNASGGSYIYMAFAAEPLVGQNNIPAVAR